MAKTTTKAAKTTEAKATEAKATEAKAEKKAAKKAGKKATEKKVEKAVGKKAEKKAAKKAGGLRPAFRDELAHAAEKKGGKVGTRTELLERLLAKFPGDKAKANIQSYIAYAKGGTMTGCHVLLEDADGNLRTGKLIAGKRAAAE